MGPFRPTYSYIYCQWPCFYVIFYLFLETNPRTPCRIVSNHERRNPLFCFLPICAASKSLIVSRLFCNSMASRVSSQIFPFFNDRVEARFVLISFCLIIWNRGVYDCKKNKKTESYIPYIFPPHKPMYFYQRSAFRAHWFKSVNPNTGTIYINAFINSAGKLCFKLRPM